MGRGLEDEAPVLGIFVDFDDAGETIDVALHDVAAQERVGPAGSFEVGVAAGGKGREGGPGEGFADDIEIEGGEGGGDGGLGDGEADAGDGDGFAQLDALAPVTGGEGEAQAEGAFADGFDASDGLYEPGEHGIEDSGDVGQPCGSGLVGNGARP